MAVPVVLVRQSGRRPLYVQLGGLRMSMGRDCDGLVLADAMVSRRHLHLELTGNTVVLSDLGSTNGTFVDGVRVATPVVFRAGIEVQLGDATSSSCPTRTRGAR